MLELPAVADVIDDDAAGRDRRPRAGRAMIPFALAAAFCFALSSVLHQRAAKHQPQYGVADPRLLLRLFKSRTWLSGWVPDTAGAIFQVLALRIGTLAVVQPVMASGLFMAVLIEAAVVRRRVAPRDLIAVAIGIAGLTAFLLIADIRPGVSSPRPAAWTVPAICAAVVISACVLAAHRLSGAARGALLGTAGGIAYSLAAALVKDLTGGRHGTLLATVVSWPAAALVVVVAIGLLLNQTAFQNGRLAAPLTALTLMDPVTSTILGITVFGESLTVTPVRIIGLVLAAATVAAAVWLAATSSAASR
ncbi:DMT family transporter [Micromonospora sp. WMMA1363]|uniref:DMT family transporter n=1 Tax=Micromonospora sp. WMMA1363 TaxID=3053985 RepID=UPI00259CDB2B|nr:DMT family transporter [Micromonospora sp. WMMA1363]MDM4719492.1 DMT family transporter [Micromonospora sp. WMMA1363]